MGRVYRQGGTNWGSILGFGGGFDRRGALLFSGRDQIGGQWWQRGIIEVATSGEGVSTRKGRDVYRYININLSYIDR